MVRDVDLYMIFDGDAAGIKAMIKAAPLFLKNNMLCKVVILPDDMDPDDFINTKGIDAFNSLLNNAISIVDFIAEKLLLNQDGSLTSNERLINEIKGLLDACQSNTLKCSMAQGIASKLSIPDNILLNEFSPQNDNSEFSSSNTVAPQSTMLPAVRRIMAFLLHYPDQFITLKKSHLYYSCSDPLSYYIYSAFDSSSGNYNYNKMFQNKIYLPQITSLLSKGNIDRTLLSKSTMEKEREVIQSWLLKKYNMLSIQNIASQVTEAISNQDLPNKDI